MMTAVSIFSCTNDYDPGLIENLGLKEQPLRIITKVLTTKSPNFMQEFTRGSVIGLHVVSESTGNIYDSNPDYKNVRAEAFLVNYKLNWRQSPDIYLNEGFPEVGAKMRFQYGFIDLWEFFCELLEINDVFLIQIYLLLNQRFQKFFHLQFGK